MLPYMYNGRLLIELIDQAPVLNGVVFLLEVHVHISSFLLVSRRELQAEGQVLQVQRTAARGLAAHLLFVSL